MPRLLQGGVSWSAVFGLGSVMLCLLPRARHAVEGEALPAAEFWSRGLGPAALVMGLWLSVTAWGLLQRAPWSRATTVAAGAVLGAAELAVDEGAGAARSAGLAVGWALASGLYLFRGAGAVRYFGSDQAAA
jgi:hypothetical protein